MVTASGKYIVIEADTLPARRRLRIKIEDELKKDNLSPVRRVELQYALREALLRENDAQRAADETPSKKKEGEEEGEGGEGSSSGGSGGGETNNGSDDTESGEGLTGLELFELLFFFIELGKDPAKAEAILAGDYSALEPLAAATLLFNKQDRSAHIEQPYEVEKQDRPQILKEVLSSLEKHAAELGARAMHLKVHADAVNTFIQKFGYEAQGEVIKRGGKPIQKMRKPLLFAQMRKNTAT